MFKKGQSGNPNGRPKGKDCAADAIRMVMTDRNWTAAANTLFGILCVEINGELKPNPYTNGQEKCAAYNTLADRAHGRPVQKQINIDQSAPPIDEEKLEELQKEWFGKTV